MKNSYGNSKYAIALEEHIFKIENSYCRKKVSRIVGSVYSDFRSVVINTKTIKNSKFRFFIKRSILIVFKNRLNESITFENNFNVKNNLIKLIKYSLNKEIK